MKTERFEMRAAEDFLASVDEWRRKQPDIPTRAEAIRRLVETGLDVTLPVQIAAVLLGGGYIVSETTKGYPKISLRSHDDKEMALDGGSFKLPFPLHLFEGLLDRGFLKIDKEASNERKTVYRAIDPSSKRAP